jgi:hypothetical protein
MDGFRDVGGMVGHMTTQPIDFYDNSPIGADSPVRNGKRR